MKWKLIGKYIVAYTTIAAVGLALATAGFSIFLMFGGCNQSTIHKEPPPPTDTLPVSKASNWKDEIRENLHIVCIEGHAYYYSNISHSCGDGYAHTAVLAPKLENNGLPVICGPELEKEIKP